MTASPFSVHFPLRCYHSKLTAPIRTRTAGVQVEVAARPALLTGVLWSAGNVCRCVVVGRLSGRSRRAPLS
jgi:hypothetical protein